MVSSIQNLAKLHIEPLIGVCVRQIVDPRGQASVSHNPCVSVRGMPTELCIHVWRRLSGGGVNALELERSRTLIVFDAHAGTVWTGFGAFLRSLRHEYGSSSACIQYYSEQGTGASAACPPNPSFELQLQQDRINVPSSGKLVLVVIYSEAAK